MGSTRYIQVLLPLCLDFIPWYTVDDPSVHVGQKVSVLFCGKAYIGVVWTVDGTPDVGDASIKPVSDCNPGLADVLPGEMKLWSFISSYYMCPLGEVFFNAYPRQKASEEMKHLERVMRQAERTRKKAEELAEKLEKRYQRELARALKKGLDLPERPEPVEIPKIDIRYGAPVVHREWPGAPKPLLIKGWDRTGEYVKAIRRTLEEGRDCLVLVPESEMGMNMATALLGADPGLEKSLRQYTASVQPAKRRDLALDLRGPHDPVVIVGFRSAVLLPYHQLGLVIVDEEQDPAYKQQEAPRYNGRDTAAVLSTISNASLILGSVCPSLESLQNCISGKYDFKELSSERTAVDIIDINAERRKRGMVGDFSRKSIDIIRSTSGLVTILRCYRTEDEVVAQISELFPDMDPLILTPAAARKLSQRSALTVVLNADALFDRDNYRSDEKVLQLLTQLQSRCDRLVVQCGSADHPVYTGLCNGSDESALLAERKALGLPPYTRIVDLRDRKSGAVVRKEILAKDSTLASRKEELLLRYGSIYVFDVDPN